MLAGEVRARARVMDRVQDTVRVQVRDRVQVRVSVRVSVRVRVTCARCSQERLREMASPGTYIRSSSAIRKCAVSMVLAMVSCECPRDSLRLGRYRGDIGEI